MDVLRIPAVQTPEDGTWIRSLAAHARRAAGLACGIAVHLLFAFTVWHLFHFLRDGRTALEPGFGPPPTVDFAWGRDLLLAVQFAAPHSLLLWPPFASRAKRFVPAEFYGLLFCAATCIGLLVTFRCWSPSDTVFWQLSGTAAAIVRTAFVATWFVLLYSLSLQGLGYQTGFTPWWSWVRGLPQTRRRFHVRGAYRWMRHPVYLSFLGLIWITPRMTWDHAVLTAVWTVYIFVGSRLKDARLAFFLGDEYRDYAAAVPGYPWGYLARLGRRSAGCDDHAPSEPIVVPIARESTAAPTGPDVRRRAA